MTRASRLPGIVANRRVVVVESVFVEGGRAHNNNKSEVEEEPIFLSLGAEGIEGLIDGGRDGLDLCREVLLDLVQVEPIVVGDQVDGEA